LLMPVLRAPRMVAPASGKRRASLCRAGKKDVVRESQRMQSESTKVLADILQSEDKAAAAAEAQVAGSFTEEFFHITSALVQMARNEGNVEMADQLESVYFICVEEKEKTLRPEIRLLNRLLRCGTSKERALLLVAERDGALQRDDGYFFELVDKMQGDVSRSKNEPLLAQLKDIESEARAAIADDGAVGQAFGGL